MHAAEWIARHGNKVRRISHTRLRHELVRQAGFCSWCNMPTGDSRQQWCSSYCRNEFASRTISRAAVWCKTDGRCSRCGVELDSTTWEVHHELPVASGGGLCGIDGLNPVCSRCHGIETSRYAAARAMLDHGCAVRAASQAG